MEEKKEIRVSLSTFFLIVAIIAIGVMGYFIYKLNDDKTKETEKASELNNQVTSLENQVDSLKEKLNSTSNTITSKSSTNTTTTNPYNSNKEIYKRCKVQNFSETELSQYPEEYIVLDGNSIYFSSDLVNKVLEGTYKIINNKINYTLLKDTQDYAFYTAASYKLENINGKKNIIVDNGENGIMYFEKVD